MKFGNCLINRKYSLPFAQISQAVVDTDPLVRRVHFSITPLAPEDKAQIEAKLDVNLLKLIGVENAIINVKCTDSDGKVVFESEEYKYLSDVSFDYNNDNWVMHATFLTQKMTNK